MALSKRHSLVLAAVLPALMIVFFDQWIKVYIKTHFYLGEDYEIFPWFHLRFVQNNGMAFGMEILSKLTLTCLRIVLVGLLVWYMVKLVRKAVVPVQYMICIALVTAGAFGNIIDCVLYGEIFTNPFPPQIAQAVPVGQGYGTWFHGLVVDMFYFPLFSFTWPQWMPWIGGSELSFFDPVFNLADASISVGIIAIIFFYHKYLDFDPEKTKKKDAEKSAK